MKKIILSKCFLHVVLLTLAFCLFPVLPAFAQEDIVNRLDKALGVTLPSEYKSKVKAFVQGSKVLEGLGVIPTEKFIKEQMKENWGINKQNQLLFIWDAIYEQITKKNFYDGEDGNKQRLEDFEKVMDNIETCGKKYKQDYTAYMQQRSEEADRRSEEADRRSEEADRRSEEADRRSEEADRRSVEALTSSLGNMVWFYNMYKKCKNENLPIITAEEKKCWDDKAKKVIEGCRELYLDYKAILHKELGDKKKVEDMLKFYGAE